MLPGKRSSSKLNLVIEESAIEKLSRSDLFVWCVNNSRLIWTALIALLVLFLVGAWVFTKRDARFQEQYIKIQSNIEKMEENLVLGKNQEALTIWQETDSLMKGQTSFEQAFQAKSAELLLLIGNQKEALPLMQETIARTKPDAAFLPFIEIAAQDDTKSALAKAKALAENPGETPIVLRAFNLLQIPSFAKALNDKNEELESINKVLALIEGRGELGLTLQQLGASMRKDRITYMDYLKERKKILTS